MTIRLSQALDQAGTADAANDAFQISLGTDPTNSPFPPGVAAGTVSSTLTGSFRASLRFSQDPAGIGGAGMVELGFGSATLSGTGFDLVDETDATPCGGDPGLVHALDPVTITSAPGSLGYVDLFRGKFELDLHTKFSFAPERRDACTDTYVPTSVMDGVGRPPFPIRIKGAFAISPALTADGRLRLGKLALSGPQDDSLVQVHTCLDAPAVPASCTATTDAYLPGRLQATAFSAEMLIGTVT